MSAGARCWWIPRGARSDRQGRRNRRGSVRIQSGVSRPRADIRRNWSFCMLRLKTLAFVPAVALAVPQTVAAAPAPLAQVQAHLQAVDTMTANFTQTDRRGQVLNGVL